MRLCEKNIQSIICLNMKQICVILLVISTIICEFVTADSLVRLPNGLIKGREASTPSGKPFYAFEGIPYATPPLGGLRFKAPLAPENWNDTLDATSLNKVCYQSNSDLEEETEDCLYINVYTPKLPDDQDFELLPVMLYIYGGGFRAGHALYSLYGPEFLINKDVIVITFNYRLGIFGFLSTQDSVIPGNAGLKDQLLALKWVNTNINLFGGDPDKVTIFGQSAGAASVSYLLLNQESKDLYRAAICQSGSALSPWAFQRNARQYAFRTAMFLDPSFNNTDDSSELLAFLLGQSAKDLDYAETKLQDLENSRYLQIVRGFFYAPVLEPEHEGAFITDKMYVSILNGNFQQVPLMIGITSEEMIWFGSDKQYLASVLRTFDNEIELLVPDDMNITEDRLKAQVAETIRQIYTGGERLQDNLGAGVRVRIPLNTFD